MVELGVFSAKDRELQCERGHSTSPDPWLNKACLALRTENHNEDIQQVLTRG